MGTIEFFRNGSLVTKVADKDGLFDITTSRDGISVAPYDMSKFITLAQQGVFCCGFDQSQSKLYFNCNDIVYNGGGSSVITKYEHNILMQRASSDVMYALAFIINSPSSHLFEGCYLTEIPYALISEGFFAWSGTYRPATGTVKVYVAGSNAYVDTRKVLGVYGYSGQLGYAYVSEYRTYVSNNSTYFYHDMIIYSDYIPYNDIARGYASVIDTITNWDNLHV